MMKRKILIKDGEKTVFKGKILNIPVKDEAIRAKSLDLFDDDDPCIIHQSFVMKQFAETLESLFQENNTDKIRFKDFEDTLDFLDIEATEDTTIEIS